MFDVFTEEIEVTLKDGIANLYWYRQDLKKCWLRAGVASGLADEILSERTTEGEKISKRRMMDRLYDELRNRHYNRRLEISRNFVRVLVEQKTFIPQAPGHRIEIAERSALKLKEIIHQQRREREQREEIQRRAREARKEDHEGDLLRMRKSFISVMELQPQKRGYALEKLFPELMRFSGITVQDPFKIEGEQIDGAIKYDGHYYLIELRWRNERTAPGDIGSFYFKAEGKWSERGIFISMNGYTSTIERTVPKGRKIKVLLLDGNHIANVIAGLYTFQELLEHAINRAVRGEIYCSHDLSET